MSQFKNSLIKIRLNILLFWGKLWRLRSYFTSDKIKESSLKYLKDNQKNLFFILGTGRSGTQLISDLLNKNENFSVFHEPNFIEDVGTMDTLRRNNELAIIYWKKFRSVEVYRRWSSQDTIKVYGEVNGTIRYQAQAIKTIFPDSKLFLLCRDGRGVVRSVMAWHEFYSKNSKGAYALSPLSDDPYFVEWSEMSRFEKICWGWRETNEYLMQNISRDYWMRLEKITTDFEYFTEVFSKKLNIEISLQDWKETVERKSRNASSVYKFPAWEDWSSENKKSFIRICGDTMDKLGYQL